MALTCREFVEFLMAYLDDELGASERGAFEGHIQACPTCMAYLDTYRETVRLGRDLCGESGGIPEDAPEVLVNAILAARRSD